MYETYYGLTARPFLPAPLADVYFPGGSIEAARQNLVRTVQRAEGPALIVGLPGSGKTMLCQVLAESCRESHQLAAITCGRLATRTELLQAILHALELPYRDQSEGELRLGLIDHLAPENGGPRPLLLICDEAQALPIELLDEIRMLGDLVRDGASRATVVVAGTSKLEERFAQPGMEAFNQRIAARCYLEPFDRQETQQYVRAQLRACGDEPEVAEGIFDDTAHDAVFRTTGGVPRLVNQVCDHALVLACTGGAQTIGAAGIDEAWADLQQLPTPATYGDEEPAGVIEFGSLDESPEAEKSVPPDEQLDQIERQLSDIDGEFRPAGVIGPEVELRFHAAHNPFAEQYAEEEVVIDPYASLDEAVLDQRPKVESRHDDRLAEQLGALAAETPRPELNVTQEDAAEEAPAAADSEQAAAPVADSTMEPATPPATETPAEPTPEPVLVEAAGPPAEPAADDATDTPQRTEYKQLFAKLRRK